jgi:uncharacterized membrane protein YoaK (UPF0700 family)
MDEAPVHRRYGALLVVLTFSTGMVDAISYLALDKVFPANMTGNVVILGMGLAGGHGVPTVGPLVALGAYVVGAAIAGHTFRNLPAGWQASTTVLFAGVGVGVLVAAVAARLLGEPTGWRLYSVVAALGLAMGVQAATARHLSVKDLTTNVITSSLTGLVADHFQDGRDRVVWARRLASVVALGSGAVAGALVLRAGLDAALLAPGAIALGAAVAGERYRRRDLVTARGASPVPSDPA